jgi:predicted GIY-YIG superfamily endonuclease
MKVTWVYILRCSDGSYYTGSTTNIEVRLVQHDQGTFPGYTSARRPVKLEWSEIFPDTYQALAAERRIKGWSRAKKLALIGGDMNLLHELAECKNDSHWKNQMRLTRAKMNLE